MTIAAKHKKLPTHVKKRSGDHHRKSKSYSKTYWPYLPMLLVIGVGLCVNIFWSSNSHVLGAKSNFSPTTLLNSTNADRTSDNESSLTLSQQLMIAAQDKANDMAARDYWSHDTPDGKTPWTFITAAGYNYEAAGENLAYGFSDGTDVVSGWMNSPEHRANILDANYTNVGFGVASSLNYQNKGPEVIVVAMYAQPVSNSTTITATVPATASNTKPPAVTQQPPTKLVSRFQLLPGAGDTWVIAAASVLFGAAIATVIIRHGLGLKRLALEGEAYFTHHPYFDTFVVAIIVAGLVLTQTSGFVR